jgi:hypothetical protein
LGTGNDLARVLGWGAALDDDSQLPKLLESFERATTKMLDRWSIMTYEISSAASSNANSSTYLTTSGVGTASKRSSTSAGETSMNNNKRRQSTLSSKIPLGVSSSNIYNSINNLSIYNHLNDAEHESTSRECIYNLEESIWYHLTNMLQNENINIVIESSKVLNDKVTEILIRVNDIYNNANLKENTTEPILSKILNSTSNATNASQSNENTGNKSVTSKTRAKENSICSDISSALADRLLEPHHYQQYNNQQQQQQQNDEDENRMLNSIAATVADRCILLKHKLNDFFELLKGELKSSVVSLATLNGSGHEENCNSNSLSLPAASLTLSRSSSSSSSDTDHLNEDYDNDNVLLNDNEKSPNHNLNQTYGSNLTLNRRNSSVCTSMITHPASGIDSTKIQRIGIGNISRQSSQVTKTNDEDFVGKSSISRLFGHRRRIVARANSLRRAIKHIVKLADKNNTITSLLSSASTTNTIIKSESPNRSICSQIKSPSGQIKPSESGGAGCNNNNSHQNVNKRNSSNSSQFLSVNCMLNNSDEFFDESSDYTSYNYDEYKEEYDVGEDDEDDDDDDDDDNDDNGDDDDLNNNDDNDDEDDNEDNPDSDGIHKDGEDDRNERNRNKQDKRKSASSGRKMSGTMDQNIFSNRKKNKKQSNQLMNANAAAPAIIYADQSTNDVSQHKFSSLPSPFTSFQSMLDLNTRASLSSSSNLAAHLDQFGYITLKNNASGDENNFSNEPLNNSFSKGSSRDESIPSQTKTNVGDEIVSTSKMSEFSGSNGSLVDNFNDSKYINRQLQRPSAINSVNGIANDTNSTNSSNLSPDDESYKLIIKKSKKEKQTDIDAKLFSYNEKPKLPAQQPTSLANLAENKIANKKTFLNELNVLENLARGSALNINSSSQTHKQQQLKSPSCFTINKIFLNGLVTNEAAAPLASEEQSRLSTPNATKFSPSIDLIYKQNLSPTSIAGAISATTTTSLPSELGFGASTNSQMAKTLDLPGLNSGQLARPTNLNLFDKNVASLKKISPQSAYHLPNEIIRFDHTDGLEVAPQIKITNTCGCSNESDCSRIDTSRSPSFLGYVTSASSAAVTPFSIENENNYSSELNFSKSVIDQKTSGANNSTKIKSRPNPLLLLPTPSTANPPQITGKNTKSNNNNNLLNSSSSSARSGNQNNFSFLGNKKTHCKISSSNDSNL